MKQFLFILLITISGIVSAQNVNIPDVAFKTYLIANTLINTNADTEIQIAEANVFTGSIDIGYNGAISDLTGIEEFVALTWLYCEGNQITSLDISNLVNLVEFNCMFNQLTSLNVANGNNTNITYFIAFSNPNLTCVEVDDAAWSIANWGASIDATASFSEDCSGTSTILVSSITVDGASGVSTITTALGSLQMVASILPINATDNSVTWSVIDITGSASINASGILTAISDGTVEVKAIANDGSAIEGTKIITISNQTVNIVSVNNISFNIYPNPSNGQFSIEGEDIKNIEIVDITGKTVKQFTMDNEQLTINLSNNPKGIYFAKITTSKGVNTEKLIIQ